jgi:hypothetical protein
MDDHQTVKGTDPVTGQRTARHPSPLLELATARDVETTFPSVTCDCKRALLEALNERCTETMGMIATRYDMVRALSRLVNEIEQAAAPVNGAQPRGLESLVATADLDTYPTGTRTPMVKLHEFILEHLQDPDVDQQDLREVLLLYSRAVEFEYRG